MGKTVVYAADASTFTGSLSIGKVSPERRKKIERLRSENDRWLSFVAEMLLQYGLREAGYDKFPPELSFNEYGKPYLKDSGIFFNISHSENWAVCAVSDIDLGCDIEKIRPIDLKIARRFCAGEYNDISSAAPEAQLELFYRYWTLKESFMKATGRGFSLGLNEFQIVTGDEVSVIQSLDKQRYSFKEFDAVEGYKCAVCMVGEQRNAEFKIVDLNDVVGVK